MQRLVPASVAGPDRRPVRARRHLRRVPAAALGLAMMLTPPAHAADPSNPPAAVAVVSAEQRHAELQAAYADAMAAATTGPAAITLLDQGDLQLPAAMVFVPQAPAERLIRAFGNAPGADLLGIVLPTGPSEWLTELRFTRAGYIRDDEAADFDPDRILAALREATEARNIARITRGIQALEISGWAEPPIYDPASHRLVWATAIHTRGAQATEQPDASYNTRLLGRDGYFSLTLIAALDQIAPDRPIARALLWGLRFAPERRYEAYVGGTDPVAPYGLGALLGVTVTKRPNTARAWWQTSTSLVVTGGILLGAMMLIGARALILRRGKVAA